MANGTRTATDRSNGESPETSPSAHRFIAALTRSGQAGYTLKESVDWKKNTLPERQMVPRKV
jgi:hypothetical protein